MHPPSARSTGRRAQAGQSLTVAIIVLFLLLFIAGLFIALVVNNLRDAGKKAATASASKFAQAGLTYLDQQLTDSPEGADWRPVPDNLANENDPDYQWLRPCDGAAEPCGFTRLSFGGENQSRGNLGGRALVRVVYQPDPTQPLSKYLKLESVGRVGLVVPSDPTTFSRSESKGQRRELIAYKSIGLNEYLRFFTNKDNRPATAALGAVRQVLDSPAGGASRPYNAADSAVARPAVRDIVSYYFGPIRSNAPLTFYGDNRFFLDPRRNDAIEVAGMIGLNNVDPQATVLPDTAAQNPARVYVNRVGAAPTDKPNLFPSESSEFNTFDALVRDSYQAGTEPHLRNVGRTAAPLIDASIGEEGLTRYRALTRNSPPLDDRFTVANPVDPALGGDFPGQIGLGQGLYINNREDANPASESLFGGYSPRNNWLTPGSQYWQSDFRYVPPAAVLTLTPRWFSLQRSATSATARSYFRDFNGRRLSSLSTIVRYSGLGDGSADPAGKPQAGLPTEGGATYIFEGYPATAIPGFNNVFEGEMVVFAEGNLRLRGPVGGRDPETGRYFRRHLTVVSNGTIYIDGNLLRDNLPAGDNSAEAQAVRGRSSIALLAKNYIVVNTTQFLSPGEGKSEPEASGVETGAILLTADPSTNRFEFRITPGPVDTYGANGELISTNNPPDYTPSLFLRHASTSVEGTAVQLGLSSLFYNIGGGTTHPVALADASNQRALYLDEVFPLDPARFGTGAGLWQSFGSDNPMHLAYDISAGISNQGDYRLTRLGVAPLDIRIEALMYAQEGSFFILPGPWFNPDPNDTYERYVMPNPNGGAAAALARFGNDSARRAVDDRFPFYSEPMDIRITFFGAITENLPAEVGDQAAWLEKWGWVPRYYGSSGLPNSTLTTQPTVHGPLGGLAGPQASGAGIVYVFDDRMILPYVEGTPIRQDAYGRVLPIAPRLPVAPGMIYVGENPSFE